MNNADLDPVSVAVALLSVTLGPQLAAIVGPYAVIVLASTTGAAWALGRREASTRTSAFAYFGRITATAVLLSVAIESAVHQWLIPTDSHWLLAPIALLVGGIGDDWPAVGRWVLERAGRLIERRAGAGGDGNA